MANTKYTVEKSPNCLFKKVTTKLKCVVSRDLGEEYEWIIYVAGLISFLRKAKIQTKKQTMIQ